MTRLEREQQAKAKARAEQRRAMKNSCADFNPKPIHQMTALEAKDFANRQARAAIPTCRLDARELDLYAQVIYDAIQYFNLRDTSHASYMRYLHECQLRRQEEQRLREEERKKPDLILHIC